MISVNDDDSNDKVRATSSKKRHLSKRERKDLKRARTSGGGGNSKLQQQEQQQQQQLDDSSMTPTARGVAEDDVTSSSSSLMNGNEKIKKRRKKKQKTREVSIHATSAMSRFSSSSSPSATTIATTTNSNTNININNPSSNNNTTTVLEEYAIAMSDPEPILLSELRCTTRSTLPCATHMLSGRLQGRLLSTLVTITNSTRILEIGTFTGYATQCLVEGANEVLLQCHQNSNNTNNTNSSNVEKKGIVVTCEIDNEAADIAREYFTKQQQQQQSSSSSSLSECSNSNGNSNKINSKNTTTIELIRGPAMETLRQLQTNINNRTSEPFDFVFLDADKRCYIRYYEYLMSNSILKVGGVILADNVLFKGLVIDNYFSSNNDDDDDDDDDDDTTKCIEVETTNITTKKEIKTSSPPKQKLNYWKRRHQDIANTVHEFNTYVNADCRSSVVLLPLRDGLSIIRKKM